MLVLYIVEVVDKINAVKSSRYCHFAVYSKIRVFQYWVLIDL